jgi:Ca2+-binding RTX toxin-like protein
LIHARCVFFTRQGGFGMTLIRGTTGKDQLTGSAGKDWIIGDLGNDRMAAATATTN